MQQYHSRNFLLLVACCFLTLLLSSESVLFAQSSKLDKARQLYKQGAYPAAAEAYQNLLKTEESSRAMIDLAACYRLMGKTNLAEEWYSRVVRTDEVEPVHLYYYGMALKANGKYGEAKESFNQYKKMTGGATKIAEEQIDACEQAEFYLTDPGKYQISLAAINTKKADFGAAFYQDGIVFSSETNVKNKGNVYNRRDQPFLDLFYAARVGTDPAELDRPTLYRGRANTKYHEATVTFSPDGSTMYFTGNPQKQEKGKVRNLKIYEVSTNGGELPQGMPFNDDVYSVGHPSLTADGDVLYFASNMPGGYGGTDIYSVKRNGTSWGVPENLGPEINTEGNEMFPYISDENTLYFSSDGLSGLGGLDIFSVTSVGRGYWSQPENLRYPINSNGDDYGFIINHEECFGYFSSDRVGGIGDDDIYSFSCVKSAPEEVETPPTPVDLPQCEVRGRIYNKKDGSGVPAAEIRLFNLTRGGEQTMLSGDNGIYSFPVDPGCDYMLMVKKKYYLSETRDISTRGRDCSSPLQQDLALDIAVTKIPDIDQETGKLKKPIRIISGGVSSHPDLPLPQIDHIYYDLDQHFIRPDAQVELDKIVQFMMDNPELILELESHTDSRGSAEYNQALSERRANAAIEYIVEQGISRRNISGFGYGETRLTNGCKDGVQCEETEHQANRRTEFVITGFLNWD